MPDANAVVERWFAAIEARDAERITGMMADDVSMETEVLREPVRGKATLRTMLAQALDAYESIRIDRRKTVASGRNAAVLVDAHARFGDDLEMFGERLSTAGEELTVRGAVFVEVNDSDQISRIMRVRDTLDIVQQLGLSPERVGELTRAFQEWMKEPPSRAA